MMIPLITLEIMLTKIGRVTNIPACIVVIPNSSMNRGINAMFIRSKTWVNRWLKLTIQKFTFLARTV